MTYRRLREVLSYDPLTGIFRWKALTHRRANYRIGDIAGTVEDRGFRSIAIDGRRYAAAHLAFFWMTKRWPECRTRGSKAVVDRIDRDPANTAWSNLRLAEGGRDKANSRRNRNRCEGPNAKKGAYLLASGKYRAAISADNKTRDLGTFATSEEAHNAYFRAAEVAFGAFACRGE